MNVIDKYRGWETDLIKTDVKAQTLSYGVCMINLEYDFNFGTLVRNCNAFGVRDVFYVSDKKKWDKRSAVGTYNYTNVTHLTTLDELLALQKSYIFVGIENNCDAEPLHKFEWPRNPLIIFGSENLGIPHEVLDLCKYTVEIPMMGSVRSLNVGTASGIVLHNYMTIHK